LKGKTYYINQIFAETFFPCVYCYIHYKTLCHIVEEGVQLSIDTKYWHQQLQATAELAVAVAGSFGSNCNSPAYVRLVRI